MVRMLLKQLFGERGRKWKEITILNKILVHDKIIKWPWYFFCYCCVHMWLYRWKSAKLATFFVIGCENIHLIRWKSTKFYVHAKFTHFSWLIFLSAWFSFKLVSQICTYCAKAFFFPVWFFGMHNFLQLLS